MRSKSRVRPYFFGVFYNFKLVLTAHEAEKGFHSSTNETQRHYHVLVYFEPSHRVTSENIAKYIGISPEMMVKLKRSRYAYNNNLAYLTHIKYENKI